MIRVFLFVFLALPALAIKVETDGYTMGVPGISGRSWVYFNYSTGVTEFNPNDVRKWTATGMDTMFKGDDGTVIVIKDQQYVCGGTGDAVITVYVNEIVDSTDVTINDWPIGPIQYIQGVHTIDAECPVKHQRKIWPALLIAGAVVVSLIVVAIGLRRRRKRRQEESTTPLVLDSPLEEPLNPEQSA